MVSWGFIYISWVFFYIGRLSVSQESLVVDESEKTRGKCVRSVRPLTWNLQVAEEFRHAEEADGLHDPSITSNSCNPPEVEHLGRSCFGYNWCFQELLELFWRIFFHLATADLLLLKVVVLWFALKADHFMNLWWKKGLQSVAEASWQLMVSTIFGVFSGNICIYICIYNIIYIYIIYMYVYIQYQLYLYTSQIYSANMQSTSLTRNSETWTVSRSTSLIMWTFVDGPILSRVRAKFVVEHVLGRKMAWFFGDTVSNGVVGTYNIYKQRTWKEDGCTHQKVVSVRYAMHCSVARFF